MNTLNGIVLTLVALTSVCYADANNRALLEQARGGNPVAMRKLSISLMRGDEGKKNAGYAFEWMKKAADAGDVPALFQLGAMYENGKCTPKSISQAVSYYEKAAKKDHQAAVEKLDKISLKHSRQWHEYAAKNGRYKSTMLLAKAYAAGLDSLPKKKDDALRYFRMAYEQDAEKTIKAVMKLPLDQTAAFMEYLAEKKKDRQAMMTLANAYENGKGVEADEDRSNKYYMMAAAAGDDEAKSIVEARGLNKPEPPQDLPEKEGEKSSIASNSSSQEPHQDGKQSLATQESEHSEEQVQEKGPAYLSRGAVGKLPLSPYRYGGWKTLSGECRFADEYKTAVIIEDGRKFWVSKIMEMENETVDLARMHAQDAVGVLASKNWNAFADYVQNHDFCGDPMALCYLNTAAQWGNDTFAVRIYCDEDGIAIPDALFDAPKVSATVKENIRKLLDIQVDISVGKYL